MPSPRGAANPGLLCCSLQAASNRNVIKPLEQHIQLPRTDVLRACLALDDAALSWVCDQLLRIRAQVYEQVYVSNRKPLQFPAEETEAPPLERTVASLPSHAKVGADLAEKGAEDDDNQSKEPPRPSKPADAMMLRQDANAVRAKIRERDQKLFGLPAHDQAPMVQFEAAISYCVEGGSSIDVGVIRIGRCDTRSSVTYATRDLSAKAGHKYIATSGTIVFELGERLKFFRVQTMDDNSWDATLEFAIDLSAKGLENCFLGRYLRTTRVKIIDDDCFPSNRFRKHLASNHWDDANKALLMLDYFRLNFRNKVVRRGMLKTMLADQFTNLYFVLGLFLNLYMVDYVLCEDCDKSSASQSLTYIIVLMLVPFPFIHYLEYREAFWKVGGATRMTLQSNLLRKYLSYDVESLQTIDESQLILAMTRDAQELAKEAFGKIPPLIGALSRLVLILLYQIITPLALGKAEGNSDRLLIRFAPAVLFPVLMLAYLRLRTGRSEELMEVAHQAQNNMIHHVTGLISHFSIVRDYRKRGVCVDQFEGKVRNFNNTLADSNGNNVNNQIFARWCTLVITTTYIWIGGVQVSNDNLAIGEFLNYLAIFKALGDMWGRVYEMLLSIQGAFNALESITTYMNLPTESSQRMAQYENNLAINRAAKQQRFEENADEDPSDAIFIELRDLEFQYKSSGTITCSLQRSSIMMPQGGFYALVGAPSEGKGTILKLLGEVLIPYIPGFTRNSAGGGGDLVVPSHLRALHVSKDPVFLNDTLLQNLLFGVSHVQDDGSKDRAIAICRKLKISESVLATIEADDLVCQWLQVLSSTDAALLHVARALIANPEILCMHKPALFLNNEMSDHVYQVLKGFVEQRGINQDPAEFHLRRPRTCIVTARRAKGVAAAIADAVYDVSINRGVVLLDKANC